MKTLVTGGTGFIGRYLVDRLIQDGSSVDILSRHPQPELERRCTVVVGDLARPKTLAGICRDIETVFHLGGYAHAIDERDDKGEEVNRQITVDGTRALLEESVKSGVKHFLFISSVKAMGEGGDTCLDETAESRPVTAYGKAKREAEKLVLAAARHGLSSTVLRLPMVYGPGNKGNLPRMIQAISRGRFPPLPDTGNRRSMVDVRDVIQAAMLAVTNPAAAGKIYIVTDGQAYSTRRLYVWMCEALHRPIPSWSIPLSVMHIAARIGDITGHMLGRRFMLDSEALQKLTGSAWYSSEKITRELGYRPAYTLKNSLPDMIAGIRERT